MERCRHRSFLPVRLILSTFAFVLAAGSVSAGNWQWGCIGAMGDDQIAFNRDRLIIVAGKAPLGTLDDFVRGGDSAGGAKPEQIVATYLPDDGNSGLASPMTFTAESGAGKLTLTEEASEDAGHEEDTVNGCRDETFDRSRKTYRVEGGKTPATAVKLMCLDYQLSSRGGRECE